MGLAALALWLPGGAWAAAGSHAECALSAYAMRVLDERQAQLRPVQGAEPVTLPDRWRVRWPGHGGSVWYRIDWELPCPGAAAEAPLGLLISGMSMAGEVFLNDDLLWRDESLVEPLSRSWNMPRWWLLPASALREGRNSVWVRVVGVSTLGPGLGNVQIGPAAQMAQIQSHQEWRQRTVYVFSAGLSAAVGFLLGVVWLLRRSERAFGWYALMSLAWSVYLFTLLATSSGPFGMAMTLSRVNIAAFVVYVLCFCRFTWRFGELQLPRLERALLWLAALGVAAVLLVPDALSEPVFMGVWLGFVMAFIATCLQFQWHAWRPRAGERNVQHMLLALCWLVFVVVAVHDLWLVLSYSKASETWTPLSSLSTTVVMALLLGGRLAATMRRIERFNHELAGHVALARAELAQALKREHAQALEHTKLQERLQIAHDLHDGLGSSLVRSMALVEQTRAPLGNERVLSLFKVLRDDLRQVIDYGSGAGHAMPETPVQWLAPLRHRFTALFDEMDVRTRWQVPSAWPEGALRPTPVQCLGMTRLLEEALTNAIKHSRARSLHVECQMPTPDALVLRVIDDGVGFDVDKERANGLGVGMRSMAARAERFGGTLHVHSSEKGTTVEVRVAQVLGA